MTKVVSLSEEAYQALKKLKRSGESFSDVVIRIVKGMEARSLMEYVGKWVSGDIDKVFESILHERRRATTRELQI